MTVMVIEEAASEMWVVVAVAHGFAVELAFVDGDIHEPAVIECEDIRLYCSPAARRDLEVTAVCSGYSVLSAVIAW